MNILIAPDKFKGSLSAHEAADAIAEGFHEVFPKADIRTLPMADGGEGMLEAFKQSSDFTVHHSEVHDALGRKVWAEWIMLNGTDDQTAIIESSQANGLWRIDPDDRSPLLSSTYGVGELICSAVREGATKITIGIGGSATNDAGCGMASALGIRFLDVDDIAIHPVPQNFGKIRRLDNQRRIVLPPIVVACDVDNPLLGSTGASVVYGRQKGLTDAGIEFAENAVRHFSDIVDLHYGTSRKHIPGAGAAGGLGYGLMSFCGAELVSGFDCISTTLEAEKWISAADFVVTGEGCLDSQSLAGKTPIGISKLAQKHGVPVFAVAGIIADQGLLMQYFNDFESIMSEQITSEEAMGNAYYHLKQTARRLAASILSKSK